MKYLISVLLLATSSVYADIIIVNNDSTNEGFNDTSSVVAIGGNTATTLGQQRLAVFEKAADILNATYDIAQAVKVASSFDPLTCSSGSAVLGQAGPAAVEFDYSTHNITPHALYNQQLGSDSDSGTPEINAQFNSAIDNNDNCLYATNWYYGFDAPTGNDKSLLSVVLHEILHGMGFLSYMGSNGVSTGGWNTSNGFEEGFDPYTRMLKDESTGSMLTALSSSARVSAMTSGTNLVWSGTNVNTESPSYSAGVNNSQIQLYAPSSYESGSSVSHFDTAVTANELMEPQYTEFLNTAGLAEQLLVDIGWSYNTTNLPNSAPVMTQITSVTLAEDSTDTVSLSATDSDGDPLTFTLSSADSSLGASVTGTTLTLNPSTNYNGSGSVTVQVSDGTDTDSTTLTVNVTAVNDAPILTGIGNQTILEDTSVNITLNATDIENDTLAYSLVSASSQLNAVISGSVLTMTPASNYNGSGSITLQVSDASTSDSETFSVNVLNNNDAPTIASISTVEFNYDSSAAITLSGSDIDGDTLTYSAVSADTGIITTSIAGNQLTLTSASNAISSTTVTVTVDDGNANATTSFTVELTDPTIIEPLTLSIAGHSISGGDTITTLALDSISMLPAGGDGGFTFTAEFNGADITSLLSTSGSSVVLDMPESGAFSGTYTVTMTDGLGSNASFYIERPLRLSTSVTPVLEGSSNVRLIIEGAPATTEILLDSDSSLSFSDANGVTIASVEASDSTNVAESNTISPTSFNAATAVLVTNDSTATTITASAANIPDTVFDVAYVARRTVTLTIFDESGNTVTDANIIIDDERMEEWELETEFTSASDGTITFDVPELELLINISAEEFNSLTYALPHTLSDSGNEASIVMAAVNTAYELTGVISAQGFDFNDEMPTLEIQLNDGSIAIPEVEQLNATQLQYTWASSLSSSLPEALSVSHSAVTNIDIALHPAFETEAIDIILISNNSTETAAGNALWLLLAGLLLIRRTKLMNSDVENN